MKKVLCINAHPDPSLKTSVSNTLMKTAQETLQTEGNLEVQTLNVYDTPIPRISKELLDAWNTNDPRDLTPHQTELLAQQRTLLDLWKTVDVFIISMPLHNFNVPSKLKDLFDNIMVSGQTFRYTEDGPIGLMNPEVKVLLIQASGSEYQTEERYKQIDYAPRYVKSVFAFMGVQNFDVVRAEGIAFQGPRAVEKQKKDQVIKKVKAMV